MEVLLLLLLAFPTMGGAMASSFGRKFWTWFFISIPLPFISCVILLCLPRKEVKNKIEDNPFIIE